MRVTVKLILELSDDEQTEMEVTVMESPDIDTLRSKFASVARALWVAASSHHHGTLAHEALMEVANTMQVLYDARYWQQYQQDLAAHSKHPDARLRTITIRAKGEEPQQLHPHSGANLKE